MGSALLDTTPETRTAEAARLNTASAPSADPLRDEVAERLAAHRNRRAQMLGQSATEATPKPARAASGRAAQIAAAVAERYKNSQSYRAFLAAEAERAVQQAQAAAEVAAMNAQAVAAAQQSLLDALDENQALQDKPDSAGVQGSSALQGTESGVTNQGGFSRGPSHPSEEFSLWPDAEPVANQPPKRQPPAHRAHPKSAPPAEPEPDSVIHADAGFTVRLYEDEASAAHVKLAPLPATALRENRAALSIADRISDDARELDEEIAFRQSPVFEEDPGPPQPLPANLIEFPRQLVASRKARPRYAEGPLREENPAEPEGQLRIFEVDAEQISTEPAAVEETTAEPQWTSIWLDTPAALGAQPALYSEPVADEAPVARPLGAPLPGVASIGRRAFAAAVNGCIILAGLTAFAAVVAVMTGHAAELTSTAGLYALLRETFSHAPDAASPAGQIFEAALMTAAFLYLAYQALFFWFAEATPGMRAARVALCTFDDNNPTRKAMRRRIVAILLSACPLGLGFIWAALDEEKLAWHDRVSQMYLRTY